MCFKLRTGGGWNALQEENSIGECTVPMVVRGRVSEPAELQSRGGQYHAGITRSRREVSPLTGFQPFLFDIPFQGVGLLRRSFQVQETKSPSVDTDTLLSIKIHTEC